MLQCVAEGTRPVCKEIIVSHSMHTYVVMERDNRLVGSLHGNRYNCYNCYNSETVVSMTTYVVTTLHM